MKTAAHSAADRSPSGAWPSQFGLGKVASVTGPVSSGDFFDSVEIMRGDLPPQYRRQWQDLSRHAIGTPFQGQQWLTDWQTHIGETQGAEPTTVFCYHEGKLAAVLPLSRYDSWGFRFLGWRGHEVNDYCAPVILPDAATRLKQSEIINLLSRVADAAGGVDLIYLTKQPTHLGGAINNFVFPGSQLYHAGVHRIQLGKDWAAYYNSQRSGKSRRRLKEKATALQKLGPVTLRFAGNGRQKAELVDTCISLKTRQIERMGHWSPFREERVQTMLVSHALGDKEDSIWAASLDVGGSSSAVAFGFAGSGSWLLYQMAMTDGPASQYSPGVHLLQHLMQHCISSGVTCLDLSLGDEPYKIDWCNEHGSLMVSVAPLTLTGRVAAAAIRARSAAILKIRSNPLAYNLSKKAKAVVRWSRPMANLRQKAASWISNKEKAS